jgi:hypothetical protein
MLIKTASWFAPIPADAIRISISRSVPRGFPAGYRTFKKLAPGHWFKIATPAEYLGLYGAVLAALDPQEVASRLQELAGDKVPTLCCWERAEAIHSGEQWCHRSIVAQWLEDRLGVTIDELDASPGFDRWALLRRQGVEPPSF